VRSYTWLCGCFGGLLVLGGLLLFLGFFRYHAPDADTSAIPTGPIGHYFVAFTGCALVGWGGALLAVARQPGSGRAVGTWTSIALVMMALYRMLGWLLGDYYVFAGDLLRFEAGLFLALAAAFLWLRPSASGELA
jgi:hypothetical protein